MTRKLVTILVLLLTCVPLVSRAQAWQPTGTWMIDDAETGCVLSHTFTSKGFELTFSFEPHFSALGAKIVLSSSDPTFPRRGSLIVTLLPTGRSFTLNALPGPTFEKAEGLIVSEDGSDFSEALAMATALRLKAGIRTVDLPTGPFAAAVAALGKCRDDRLKTYGLDPSTVIRPPAEHMKGIFSFGDYPVEAIRKGIQGRSMVAISFAADGKPTNCRVVESSGDSSLDLASCKTGFRLKLDPAAETIVQRWVVLPVRYVLPGSQR